MAQLHPRKALFFAAFVEKSDMARESREESWMPADSLRITGWYVSVLSCFVPDRGRGADSRFREIFEFKGNAFSSSTQTRWKRGQVKPSKTWLSILKKSNAAAGQFEILLHASDGYTTNRLIGLYSALDVLGCKELRRDACLRMLLDISAIWHPVAVVRKDEHATVHGGWEINGFGKVQFAAVSNFNPFNLLSILPHLLQIGDVMLAPRIPILVAREPDIDLGKIQDCIADWIFDVVVTCMLIHRLRKIEMNEQELNLADEAIDWAMWMLDWFLRPWFRNANSERVKKFWSENRIPANDNFVSLMLFGRKLFFEKLARFGFMLDDLYRIAPMLQADLDESHVEEMIKKWESKRVSAG